MGGSPGTESLNMSMYQSIVLYGRSVTAQFEIVQS